MSFTVFKNKLLKALAARGIYPQKTWTLECSNFPFINFEVDVFQWFLNFVKLCFGGGLVPTVAQLIQRMQPLEMSNISNNHITL